FPPCHTPPPPRDHSGGVANTVPAQATAAMSCRARDAHLRDRTDAMRTIRHALFAGLAGMVALTATLAQPPGKSDPKIVLQDTATRQAQLSRAFESFRQRLTVVAGRLENGSDQEKAQAKSLKKALKLISDLGTTARFDVLIRELRQKNSDQNLD